MLAPSIMLLMLASIGFINSFVFVQRPYLQIRNIPMQRRPLLSHTAVSMLSKSGSDWCYSRELNKKELSLTSLHQSSSPAETDSDSNLIEDKGPANDDNEGEPVTMIAESMSKSLPPRNLKPSLKQRVVALSVLFVRLLRTKSSRMKSMLISRGNKLQKQGNGFPSTNNPDNNGPNGRMARLLLRLKKIVLNPRSLTILMIMLVIARRYWRVSQRLSATIEVPFSNFLELLSDSPDRIKGLRVAPSAFRFLLDGKQPILSRPVHVESKLMDKLVQSGIEFASPPPPRNVLGLVGTLLYAFFLWKVANRMLQGPQDGEGAGKSREKMNLQAYGNLSFQDVAGQDGAKLEVQEVCEMLKDPTRYARVGARLPAGVLLVGPPGSGKTLLARVTAAEARVPFYACSASDFVEVFVGRGPARVRKLFKQAAQNAPSIVFIDEIDSIGRSRKSLSMNTEQETTLNQILTCMDGLDTSNNGVIVMAATNRLELLDTALLRAGRFDRIVQCPLPDKNGRLAILRVHTRSLQLADDVDLDRIATLTPGTSGADLSALCNEAAIRAVRRQGYRVQAEDFEEALKAYVTARGMSLQSIGEIAASALPTWLTGGSSSSSSNTGGAKQ